MRGITLSENLLGVILCVDLFDDLRQNSILVKDECLADGDRRTNVANLF